MQGLLIEDMVRAQIEDRERRASRRRTERATRRKTRLPARSWVLAGTLTFWHPRG